MTFSCFCSASAAALPESSAARVTIDLRAANIQSFLGLGIQWDPYSYPPQPEAWKRTLQRLDFARPAFFRVMLGARDYCRGFDAHQRSALMSWSQGEPAIRQRLGSLLDLPDYAQSRNIEVLLGEWSPPDGWATGPTTPSAGRTIRAGRD